MLEKRHATKGHKRFGNAARHGCNSAPVTRRENQTLIDAFHGCREDARLWGRSRNIRYGRPSCHFHIDFDKAFAIPFASIARTAVNPVCYQWFDKYEEVRMESASP